MQKISVKVKCPKCNDKGSLVLNYERFLKWQSGGMLIQEAFPDLNAAERERLITGWCDSCWTNIFGEEE